MKISEILSTPYVLEVESIENSAGETVCQATFAELPHCLVQHPNPLVALSLVDEQRLINIFQLIEQGQAVPVPRPPFKDRYFGLTSELLDDMLQKLGLQHWQAKLEEDVPVKHHCDLS